MGRQIRPARVYQTATQEIATAIMPGYRVQEPPWYKVMYSIPPSEILTRSIPVQHKAGNPKARKPRNIFKPQQIRHEEDHLRTNFYKDHPWELARPRIIIELDGKDAQKCDWGKGLRQPGLPLSGESAVQRQLWLMNNAGLKKNQAYDVARREFYALRQEEEIERRVAREEARFVGAYFGKTRIEIGMGLEDKEYEKWKVWAGKETARMEQQSTSAYQDFSIEAVDAVEEADVDGSEVPGAVV